MALDHFTLSDFSPEDIKPEILAEELGVSEFRFPDEDYLAADIATQRVTSEFVPAMLKIPSEKWGDFLLDNEDNIFRAFGVSQSMWRFPILVTREMVFRHIVLNADLLGVDVDRFYSAFMNCMYFFLYFYGAKEMRSLMQKHTFVPPTLASIQQVIEDEVKTEIRAAWGVRYRPHVHTMLGEKGDKRMNEILNFKPFHIPVELRDFYRQKKLEYWRQKGLPPERIFLNVLAIMQKDEEGGSKYTSLFSLFMEERNKKTLDDQAGIYNALDVEGMSFFFCQNHIAGYTELVRGMKEGYNGQPSDHIHSWKIWISQYFNLLKNNDSETHKLFRYIFQLEGPIFLPDGTDLTRRAKAKIPEPLHEILIASNNAYQKIKRTERERTKKAVQNIPATPPAQTATAHLVTRAVETPKKILHLDKTKIFVKSAKENTQLVSIDFTHCPLPTGSVVLFERKSPRKGDKFKTIDIKPAGFNLIEPLVGREYEGHFEYRLTVKLPSTHKIADGQSNILTERLYAKADLTQAEIEAEKQDKVERAQKSNLQIPVQKLLSSVVSATDTVLLAKDGEGSVATPDIQKPLKNPKQTERDDLKVALEIFLGSTSQNELLDLCEIYARCEGTGVVLEFPETLLVEYGYVSEHLSAEEVQTQLKWSLTIKKEKVTSEPELPQSINAIAPELAKRIREKKEIQFIDEEFSALGFMTSPTRDNDALRKAIRGLSRNDDVLLHSVNSKNDEVRKHGARIFGGRRDLNGLHSVTLSKEKGWKATLLLYPEMQIRIDNPPKENTQLHRERAENALLTFVFEVLSKDASKKETLEQTIQRTKITENQRKLRTKYRAQLLESKARLLIQLPEAKFHTIDNLSKDNLEAEILKAQKEYGFENVAILYRAQSYHFHGNGEFYQPTPEKLALTYEDFLDPEVGEDRRKILQERILRTLFNGASGLKSRAPFIPGSEVDGVLQSMVGGKEIKKYGKDSGKEKEKSNGKDRDTLLTKEHIDDKFVKKFIVKLRSEGVAVTFHDALAGYCEKIDELIAAQ